MKILVFNGSPKRDKSDTMHITRAFLEGMREVGEQDVQIVNVIDKHIEYCTGCFVCKKNGGTCIFDDDMREILEGICASDLLVFSHPLYAYGMPAPLKALVDRLMPLTTMAMRKSGERYEHIVQGDFSRLKFLMICGCGFPNSKHNFEPAVDAFKLKFPFSHTIMTVPESPMFNVPEAAAVTVPRLELVKRAGREYAETGTVGKELLAEINSPMIPEEVYASIVNSDVNA